MSALAMGLLKKGCSVSGSDLVKNDETKKLEELGAVIFTSQIQQNIEFVISKFTNKLINFVVSSAIKPENEEFSYKKKKFINKTSFRDTCNANAQLYCIGGSRQPRKNINKYISFYNTWVMHAKFFFNYWRNNSYIQL